MQITLTHYPHTMQTLPGQYTTSAKLDQYYVSLPCKLRLVALVAFLKWKCEPDANGKVIVFFSSRDIVQFYKQLFKVRAVGQPAGFAPRGDWC